MSPPSEPPQPPLSAEIEVRRPRHWWTGPLAFLERLFIFGAIYVFSIGPMYWFWMSGYYGGQYQVVAYFYEPLRRAGEAFEPFGEWLNWYVRWWIFG